MIDTYNKLSSNLTLNKEYILDLLNEHGIFGTAKILGYDINHYDNLLFAGKLLIEDLKNKVPKTIKEYMLLLKNRFNTNVYNFYEKYEKEIQEEINNNEFRDYENDWFSGNTIINSYSLKNENLLPLETPQYIWMRVAVQMYFNESLEKVFDCYRELSIGYYTPASPTLFNAGLKKSQMASCFLLTINDNLESILKNGIYRGGIISKNSGGLGFDISRVRHSKIDVSGKSSGIVPMLQLYNSMVRYVDQGGKRKGAATIYLRPHHIDIEDFISLPKKVGDRYERTHDLNICIWTSWIFWERIKNNLTWTMFCPAQTPLLNDIYGKEFEKQYIEYENDISIPRKTINARELYNKILNVQRETGMPYIMNGDASNIKSNHKHMGYIRSSNLCLEIIEYTDDETIAVCNLHSLSLRMFGISPLKNLNFIESINFKLLGDISKKVLYNLNKIIDNNVYPLDKVKDGEVKPNIINKSNKRDRPVGLGVSGFAELLYILDLHFEDERVPILNKMIFACIYWNALAASVNLAIKEGKYETFEGSPYSQGKLQFDLWREEFELLGPNNVRKREDDIPIEPLKWKQEEFKLINGDIVLPTWEDLKRCIIKYGTRNSLITALMPTATTSQIRRNCETVEAHQNNLYSRKVLNYGYPVLNRFLVKDLQDLNLWNENIVEYLRVNNGSIQGLSNLLSDKNNERILHLEKKYKTMWEIPQKVLMKLSADRSRYIDQSSSMNLYLKNCTDEKLGASHIYASMLGLKTIMYYLRQTGGDTIKFTANPSTIKYIKNIKVESESKPKNIVCTDEICTSCS